MSDLRKGVRVVTSDRIRVERYRGKAGTVVEQSRTAAEWMVRLDEGGREAWFTAGELTLEATGGRPVVEIPDLFDMGDGQQMVPVLGENRWKVGYPVPKGSEAQCPRCSLIFANDSTAYGHQRQVWGTMICLDPAYVGLVTVGRGGREVWYTVEGATKVVADTAKLEKAHAARRAGSRSGGNVEGPQTARGYV